MELTKDVIEMWRNIIEKKDKKRLLAELTPLHPADIAELFDELDLDEILYLYSHLDNERAGDVLMELDEENRHKLLKRLPSEFIAHRFVDNLNTDDAVDLIQELDKDTQADVLKYIKNVDQAGDIADLLRYDEDTAGGLMGTEMIVVNENWSMPQCVEETRKQGEKVAYLYYIYVIDDDERLVGVLPVKKLITSPSVYKIKNIMKCDPIAVKEEDTVETVTEIIDKYDLVALPVIDTIGRLVGQITVDDVVDEMREQHERDYQLASGISQDVETSDTVVQQTTARLPWLIIGILGGVGTSALLGLFTGTMTENPAMAIFIPLIAGTGGNVGIQSSAIVVQGLANNSLKPNNMWSQIMKETFVALINASILSLLVYTYNFFMLGNMILTAAVSFSLFAVVMFASVFGTIVPIVLQRLHIDPALATGPFITITDDMVGMLIYMYIVTALL